MLKIGFVESLREPGLPIISANKVAGVLHLQLQDIAVQAKVHRNTVRTHPESPALQKYLKNVVRVISAASAVSGDLDKALYFVRNEPLPVFGHRTAMDMVAEGRTDEVVDYLESIEAGFVG